MNPLEKKLRKGIFAAAEEISAPNGGLAAVTQGLRLQLAVGGRLRADLSLGETYKYYDLASLTKIIFTVPAFMRLYDQKQIALGDSISSILSWWPHRSTRLEQVLSHSAGLPWWAPFYQKISLKASVSERREQVRKILQKTVRTKTTKAIYSDLDFILLGFVLEELHGAPLLDIWQSLEWREETPNLHFNVNNRPSYSRALYAPTERCPWRKKVLRGEVHDDNTWSFGGVSTHAGLFGTIDDVTRFGLLLRAGYRQEESASLVASTRTTRKFTKRAIPVARGDWAMGFMHPTRGQASCGKYFHSSSFGHTGFTGTSLWYDPKRDVLLTLLSNRVYPTRENTRFVKLRPLIHDLVMKNI